MKQLITLAISAMMCLTAQVEVFSQTAAPRRRPKPDFKVLYSNDTTNIGVSPLRRKEGVTFEEIFCQTIDETAEMGVDVHLLQPGVTWAPFWKSKLYPIEEHIEWLKENHPDRKLDRILNYLAEGGDIVGLFIERARKRGMEPFVSLRLNHHASSPLYSSKFYADNPQFLTGPWQPWISHQNWAHKEVREHRLAIIKEICENYDIAGLELDFLRYPIFFDNWKSYFPLEKRRAIMNEFVAEVRRILDETTPDGKYRYLAVRVPHKLIAHPDLGINLVDFSERGVEMVTLSSYYFTNQDTDLKVVRSLLPNTAIYLEMTYANGRGKADVSTYRHYSSTTQIQTTALVGYEQGADGVALFNFAYYRFLNDEPPFHIIKHLRDSDYLKRRPAWYFLDYLENHFHGSPAVEYMLPKTLKKKDEVRFTKEIFPQNVHSEQAVVRILADIDLTDSDIKVRLNNKSLKQVPFSQPLEHEYPKDMDFDKPNLWACYVVDKKDLNYGPNQIRIQLNEGSAFTLRYLDILLPTQPQENPR